MEEQKEEARLYIRKRANLKGQLTKFYKAIVDLPEDANEGYVQSRHVRLLELWPKSEEIYDHLENVMAADDAQLQMLNDDREQFESNYFETDALYRTKLSALTASSQALLSSNTIIESLENANRCSTRDMKVRLPKLEIPCFDGKFDEWLPFWDVFRSLIFANEQLPNVQKFQYLKTSVKGEAYDLIKNLATTDDNFDEACDMLSSRYDHKRTIVNSHLAQMMNFENLKSETAYGLRQLINNFQRNLASLRAMNYDTDRWNEILVFMLQDKLPAQTRRQWELSLTDTSAYPTFDMLCKFILSRTTALENSCSKTENSFKSEFKSLKTESRSLPCPKCNQSHKLSICEEFKGLTVSDRFRFAKDKRLCINCLLPNHLSSNCSNSPCRTCHKLHHTLLHFGSGKRTVPSISDASVSVPTDDRELGLPSNTTSLQSMVSSSTHILLTTAKVYVKLPNRRLVMCRVILDNGSQSSFITARFVRHLQLPTKPFELVIDGIGSTNARTSRCVDLEICSVYDSSISYRLRALVLPTITDCIPTSSFDRSQCTHLNNISLADPSFNVSAPVDLLLSSDIFMDCLKPGKIEGPKGTLSAISSTFGWLIGGRVAGTNTPSVQTYFTLFDPLNLERAIRDFLTVEEVPSKPNNWTTEEAQCEELFVNAYKRLNSGRFVVKLPFCKASLNNNNYSFALRRFSWLERKMDNDKEFALRYRQFILECIDLGHMVRCEDQAVCGYYLPHHGVLKESSTTTSLRVVFDGSSVYENQESLNSVLHTGPKLQNNILDLLLRFRKHRIAFSCDLEKMFRQILIAEDDQQYQKVLFRFNPTDSISTYRFTTVVYGLRPSPYLAVRCLMQAAYDAASSHRLASAILINDTYVDDVVSGADSLSIALQIRSEIVDLLSAAGFRAHKWSSNCPEMLKSLPIGDHSCQSHVELFSSHESPLLGLIWVPSSDSFRYRIKIDSFTHCTKRLVLSQIAKLFDPYGWIGPVVLFGKLFIQNLWSLKCSWDQELPVDIQSKWLKLRNELHLINTLEVSRFIGNLSDCEIHAFCDASTLAYGCCIYVKDNNGCKLLAAKSKVAPLKQLSLPRLELCGLSLAIKLLKVVLPTLELSTSTVHVWLDSTIVLAWLSRPSRAWSVFVANRVAEVQDYLEPSQFHHVRSKDNPADFVSRGCYPSQLLNNTLWWSGPTWLSGSIEFANQKATFETDLEIRKSRISVYLSVESLINRFSNFGTLCRVTAYVLRFVNGIKFRRKTGAKIESLSVSEVQSATLYICKLQQMSSFSDDYNSIKAHKPVSKRSKLFALSPFIDKDEVIRVHSRLANSSLAYSTKFPIILDHTSYLSKLIVRSIHVQYLHSGIILTCSIVRKKYWIIKLKSLVRQVIRTCTVCQRYRAKNKPQLMAALPDFRTEINPPFTHVGLDFCGPFSLVLRRTRGKPVITKSFCCVFVCLTTKAVHLELLSDLTTASFMASFRRFYCRRRIPDHLYSDNAKTFVASKRYISDVVWFLQSQKSNLSSNLVKLNVRWHFIPPYTPHMGGMWESCVKSLKYHLKRVIGIQILTFEELSTILIQIEQCLNSRPLTAVSDDIENLNVLTPNHFLNGDYTISLPDIDTPFGASQLGRRWSSIQNIVKSVWSSWKQSYLHQLAIRNKWRKEHDSIKIGDIVIVVDKCSPPALWLLGRVEKEYPGRDGICRSFDVKINSKIKRKSATNLVKLYFD